MFGLREEGERSPFFMRYFLLFLTLLFLSPSVTASAINCDPNT
ncbi:TPA: minor coat protein pIII, partial [Vibrio cholerae]